MSTITQRPILHGRDHACGGADPIPGICDLMGTTGDGIMDILLSKSAVGVWKLDELSGSTAVDSSGAGNHMTVPAGYDDPTWGEPAGPPGTTSARFAAGATNGTRLNVAMPSGMTDDFSAGLWVYVNDTGVGQELLGQGSALHGGGAGGWNLVYNVSSDKFALHVGGSIAECNNVSAAGDWYLFGVSRVAGTWTLYLDGLTQVDTDTTAPSSAETATWIADCGFVAANHGSNQTLSWAFITDDPLSGADWLALYEAGSIGGALEEGQVWMTDGSGGTSWGFPLEVTF